VSASFEVRPEVARFRFRRVVTAAVRAYQQVVSPWLRPACRFEPSCSHYTIEAIESHGVMRGAWLSARRLVRCQPFGGSGFDPVP
jgi:putative membrane protein insertion efficiency factor